MVKGWSACILESVFLGNTNLEAGARSKLMMRPIGVGLHDPSTTCLPLVRAVFWVKQKLMKLFFEVRERTWAGSGLLP